MSHLEKTFIITESELNTLLATSVDVLGDVIAISNLSSFGSSEDTPEKVSNIIKILKDVKECPAK